MRMHGLTHEELSVWLNGDTNIQDALRRLTPGEREFLMTGMTDAEFDEMFPDE
jgi:hypothetical protein